MRMPMTYEKGHGSQTRVRGHCSFAMQPRRHLSSEKVLSPIGSDRELPSLSHRLEFNLIAHAFESLHQAFLHGLSVPLIEIIAA